MIAVIWDMDGVLVDSAEFHFRDWKDVFGKRGKNLTFDEVTPIFGRTSPDVVMIGLGDLPGAEVRQIVMEKEEEIRRRAASGIELLPGALSLLAAFEAKGYKMAIASSAPRRNVDLLVDKLRISRFFQAIVSSEDVTAGKPDPEVFLKAAEKLSAPPSRCVVFEDAIDGVKAAKAAGMKCIAVTTTHPAERLRQADLVVGSLTEVGVETVTRLLRHN